MSAWAAAAASTGDGDVTPGGSARLVQSQTALMSAIGRAFDVLNAYDAETVNPKVIPHPLHPHLYFSTVHSE